MHIRDDRAYKLCRDLYPLIKQSDIFYAEIDLDEASESVALPQYNIRSFLSAKKIEKVRHQILKSFQIDIERLGHHHPLMIMSAISASILQSDHTISLDEHLWQYASELEKPVRGLESFQEQMHILQQIDPQSIYNQLVTLSQKPAPIRQQTDKSLNLYLKGEIHPLYMMSKQSMQHMRKQVIYERNKKMSSVITQLDTSLQYFISVGAGHLSGSYGILTLLKKAGWLCKPVRLDFD